jgi:hypothetical protein
VAKDIGTVVWHWTPEIREIQNRTRGVRR